MLEAALFRLVKLASIPAGLNPDAGNEGWGALRILHEGWLPLINDSQDHFMFPAPIYYELAAWFRFFSPTPYHLFLYSALLSLVSLFFIYWFFRQLAGAPTALLTLALIAPMRWDFTLARMAHPVMDVHFFMFGCLGFGYYALVSGKKWAWLLSTLFLTIGFYTYDSFKPLLIVLFLIFLFEAWDRRPGLVRAVPTLALCLLFFLACSVSMLRHVSRMGGFGTPSDHLSIFEEARTHQQWRLVLENPLRSALMFNHRGDGWLLHNLPGHRMLDDASGMLLVLGFGFALYHWRERKYFYGLIGAALMCLPATLTVNPGHAARSFGALPFVAFLAATGLLETGRVLSRNPGSLARRGRWVLLALTLGWIAFQNGKIYFSDMAPSADFQWASDLKETGVADLIRSDGGKNDYYLTPHFYGNYTIRFLDYFQAQQIKPMPWPAGPWPPALPAARGAWFVLDRAQTGLLELLQELYPGGAVQDFRDGDGIVRVYVYEVPASALGPGFKLARQYRDSGQGLLGEYRSSAGLYTQVDPVLNFALWNDFPVAVTPPLTIQWTGRLRVKKTGLYQFLILATDQSRLVLDGKNILESGNQESSDDYLRAGDHPLRVEFNKTQGGVALFHLLWKRPGADRFEIIPAGALEIPAHAHGSLKPK